MSNADHYLAERVLTATPAQLTGMLFDAAVAALRGAHRMQTDGDFTGALPRSLKAQRILLELRLTLNHEAGGRLATELDRLYAYAHACLLRAGSERKAKPTADALDVVEQLASAWREGVLQSARVAQPV